jgi:hypothetical protein
MKKILSAEILYPKLYKKLQTVTRLKTWQRWKGQTASCAGTGGARDEGRRETQEKDTQGKEDEGDRGRRERRTEETKSEEN